MGYLYPLALIMKLAGREDLDVGIGFSTAISTLTLFLFAALAWRFFGPWTALAGTLFLAFSPMELAIARKVWQDGWMSFLAAATLFLALEIHRKRRPAWPALYAALSGVLLTVKESGVIWVALLTVWTAFALIRQRRGAEAAAFVGVTLAGCALALSAWVWLCGGAGNIIQVYSHVAEALPRNTFAWRYQTGGLGALIEGFIRLTPFTFILAIAGAAHAAFRRDIPRLGLVFLAAVFTCAASAPQAFQNLRYLSPVYAPYYLLCGSAVAAAMTLARRFPRALTAAALAVCLLIAGSDYARYRRVFVDEKTKDLATGLLKIT
ncbi:MAG: hypothetical protein A3D28_00140 [Omnitrophica bacterium RIFCSPHIGHO2_02_FULL_63_14]|nr:MAG: hypothetical protein A3D28_00140 [Omnitrophica bacterium RIFCSPHIGHO2_02_FULL_63_14]